MLGLCTFQWRIEFLPGRSRKRRSRSSRSCRPCPASPRTLTPFLRTDKSIPILPILVLSDRSKKLDRFINKNTFLKDVKCSSFFGSVVMQLLKPLESLESRLVLEIPARSRWRDHLRDVSSESIASSGWCQIFDPKCEISLLETYFLANICILCFVNVIDTIICILFIEHNEHTYTQKQTLTQTKNTF